jgi:hypothetical protein
MHERGGGRHRDRGGGGDGGRRRDRERGDRERPRRPDRDPGGPPAPEPPQEPRARAAGGGRGGGQGQARGHGGPGGGSPERAKGGIRVGTTANKPELVQTIPIASEPGKGRRVVLSFGSDTATDVPLPDLAPGDRLRAFAELEVTTDADDPNHPGLVGNAYSYSPKVEATLLLAASADEVAAKPGRAIALGDPWRQTVSHQQHHAVVTFGDARLEVPAGGLSWTGPSRINLVLSANHQQASAGDLLLVGQNEKTPTVVQDMAGIRVVRSRGHEDRTQPERESSCLCAGIPVAKAQTVVLSHRLDDLEAGEQLLVHAKLVTDAAQLGYPARISTRLFLADSSAQTEPGGSAQQAASWKGQLSKYTGFNCIPGDGPRASQKYGVGAIKAAPGRPLYVNLVAVSAAPFGGGDSSDELPIVAANSFLEVTRYPASVGG